MNKRDLLLLCCPSDNEKKLVSLLINYNKDYGYKHTAEILAFKNSLMLKKVGLNNNVLNGLLLKSYVLYLFSNKEIENNKLNNSILNNGLNTTMELLNTDISSKFYLSYVYVKTISKGIISRGLKVRKEDCEIVCSLLEKINYLTCNNEQTNSKRKINTRKFNHRVSSR